MQHLPAVRFCFYGDGHRGVVTGHLYLRYVPALQVWRLSEYNLGTRSYAHTSGSDPHAGGAALLDMLSTFVAAWSLRQQEEIGNHRTWYAARKGNDVQHRPGFRPATAVWLWRSYVRETTAEVERVRIDVHRVIDKLHFGEWGVLAHPLVFPTLTYPSPW